MEGNVGIFIPCSENKGRECLVELMRLMKPSEKFIGVKIDNTYGGLKIFFKDASEVRGILRKRYLMVSGEMFPIHPLTTSLIVHTDLFDFKQDFEDVLRIGMRHLGTVLQVSRLSLYEVPNAYTGDWKVQLDVPEIEDLAVFCSIGSPNNMKLKLPGFNKEFPMTFCCSFCDKDGHTLKSCPVIGNAQDTSKFQIVTQSSNIDSISKDDVKDSKPMSSTSQRSLEFRIRDSEEETKHEKKPTIMSNHIESWASEIGEETVRQRLVGVSSNTTPVIKNDSEHIAGKKRPYNKRSPIEDQFKPHFKCPRESTKIGVKTPSNSMCDSGPPTTNCGEVEVLFEVPSNANRSYISHNDSTEVPRPSNQDDVGQFPTSSSPDAVSESVKTELPSTDENDSDSNQGLSQASPRDQPPKRRKPTQTLQIRIPDGIKSIIRQNPGVLSEERLEAFFNHVKKKSCPSVVARQYTEDIERLKAQLGGIKDQYYNTPIIHSADEKYFMKWFENVLTRFDRKPTKKARN